MDAEKLARSVRWLWVSNTVTLALLGLVVTLGADKGNRPQSRFGLVWTDRLLIGGDPGQQSLLIQPEPDGFLTMVARDRKDQKRMVFVLSDNQTLLTLNDSKEKPRVALSFNEDNNAARIEMSTDKNTTGFSAATEKRGSSFAVFDEESKPRVGGGFIDGKAIRIDE